MARAAHPGLVGERHVRLRRANPVRYRTCPGPAWVRDRRVDATRPPRPTFPHCESPSVSVVLTGHDLTREDLVRVARAGETVLLDPTAVANMRATRDVVDERLVAGDSIYGGSTAVGVLKRATVSLAEAGAFSNRLIGQHQIAQGDAASPDIVRATMLRLANGFAAGYPGVRPVLAERLVDALNAGRTPRVRSLGSVGQADLAPMADLAADLFEGESLEAGEGLALVSSNAFSTATAALAVADAAALIQAMELAGACSLEALGPIRTCSTRPSRTRDPIRACATVSQACVPCSPAARC
jgi:histidine ammonia-lyase